MFVAIANQKGGVGKTTTAVNLATALGASGRRILLVDLDPQANATTGLGVDHRGLESSVYDVLLGGSTAASVVVRTGYGVDLLPSSIDLAGAELELVSAFARESKLKAALEPLTSDYEAVLIDCPPSLGLITVNALTAAHWMLVPIQCEYYALEGVTQLLRNVELVRAGLNPTLEIAAIVLTMYDARTKLSEQVAEEVRRHFGETVLRTVVPRSVRLSEAPSYGQPAVTYDPSSRGSLAYTWLAKEFEERFLVQPEARSEAGEVTAAHDEKSNPGPSPGSAYAPDAGMEAISGTEGDPDDSDEPRPPLRVAGDAGRASGGETNDRGSHPHASGQGCDSAAETDPATAGSDHRPVAIGWLDPWAVTKSVVSRLLPTVSGSERAAREEQEDER